MRIEVNLRDPYVIVAAGFWLEAIRASRKGSGPMPRLNVGAYERFVAERQKIDILVSAVSEPAQVS